MDQNTITMPGISRPIFRVALGTWAIGGWLWGGPDDRNAVDTIRTALDLGVNLIDTAPVYGFGHSETVVGEALAGRRDEVVIATKVGLTWDGDGQNIHRDGTAAHIVKEVEDSLRRLKTDRIDLQQVHWPDEKTPIEETARALEALLKSGKILALGVSNFSPGQIEEFRKFAPLATVQPPYNLFERSIDQHVLPYAMRNDLVILAYGPLCRGLLSGRMNASTVFDGDDLRKMDPKFLPPRFEQYLAAAEQLKAFVQARHGKSLLALAVRWVLDRGPTIALWGARKPSQIEGIGEVTGWSLSTEDFLEIDAILERTVKDPVGAEFMAPPQ